MAVSSCFFMFVRPIPEEGMPEMPRDGFGYLSRQAGVKEPASYASCTFYSNAERAEYFDDMWRAGMAMSLMACIVGGVVMTAVLCTCCVAFRLPTFTGLFYTSALCFVMQALTFLSWGSTLCDDYECTWSSGTGMNVTASMLWIWVANMIKSFPEALPPKNDRKNREKKSRYRDSNDDDDNQSEMYGSQYYDDDNSQYFDDDESSRYSDASRSTHQPNNNGGGGGDDDNGYRFERNDQDEMVDFQNDDEYRKDRRSGASSRSLFSNDGDGSYYSKRGNQFDDAHADEDVSVKDPLTKDEYNFMSNDGSMRSGMRHDDDNHSYYSDHGNNNNQGYDNDDDDDYGRPKKVY